ncbi:unnamed protein product [Ranitomeya imitator]|uniref:AP-3 complex subunit delta domain-containing protein n=1 Tax=Ranitomeya imitator TaxID=111125 RepID=A0ABN9MBW7_9NEOB|nr:unnamed protein product [Ranitomeya imitator]
MVPVISTVHIHIPGVDNWAANFHSCEGLAAGSDLPPEFSVAQFDGVAVETAVLRASGLSDRVMHTMIQARKPSSSRIYYRTRKAYFRWCESNHVPPMSLAFLQAGLDAGLALSFLRENECGFQLPPQRGHRSTFLLSSSDSSSGAFFEQARPSQGGTALGRPMVPVSPNEAIEKTGFFGCLPYISILVELTRLEGTRHGHLIAAQMLDVAIRVKAIRMFAVSQMATLLDNAHLLASNTQRNGICEVLYAAAWICGEFSEHLPEPQQTLEAMLRPKVTTLPGHIQAVYVQNVVKLYSCMLQRKEQEGDKEAAQEITQLMIDRLPQFVQSADLEVQERASCILQLIKYIQKLQAKDVPVAEEVMALFAGELNPVAPKAQKKVPIPEGLDLDSWINEPPSDSESEDEKPKPIFHEEKQTHGKSSRPEIGEEELARRLAARKEEQANNPFYIKSSPSPQKGIFIPQAPVHLLSHSFSLGLLEKSKICGWNPKDQEKTVSIDKLYQDSPGVDHIPVVQIDLSVPLKVPGLPNSDQYVKLEEERRTKQRQEKDKKRKKEKDKKSGKTRRHKSVHTESDEDIAPAHHVDIVTEEMPENALPSDDDDKDPNDPYRALDIDLDKYVII